MKHHRGCTFVVTGSVLLLAEVTLAAQARCWVEPLDPIWGEGASLLQQLRDDPFAEGLHTFAQDISGLMSEQQKLLADAQAAVHGPDCDNAAAMNAHNARVVDVVSRMKRAVDRAKELLRDDHAEESFWLMAERYRHSDCNVVGPNDCEAMARLFAALGKKTDWNLNSMLRIAGRVLSDGVRLRVGGQVVRSLVEPGPRRLVPFCQGGFRTMYLDQDPNSRNQVRHFIGYLALGNSFSGDSLLSKALAEYRDGNDEADYLLGIVAANLGRRLRDNPSSVRGVDGAIRSTICR
jgi:hypothetical protein